MMPGRAPLARSAGREVALVHDYLMQYGGAEKVLEALHALWPGAPVYTTFYDRQTMARLGFGIPPAAIRSLLPNTLPHRGRWGKLWTPVYPLAMRRLDLGDYRLVISSSSFAAHQVRRAPGARHICYSHSPPRFLYGLSTEVDHARLRRLLPAVGPADAALRALDQDASRRVDAFVANSEEVRRRIARWYGRQATVIHPPVQTRFFAQARPTIDGAYFLAYGRLVRSKRVDLIVRAANLAGVPLVVAGRGPEQARLRALAGPRVRFVGHPDGQHLLHLLENCKAVVFAAEEDFGIVPVEAMAAGKPVIAYGGGGVVESVAEGLTGEFFRPQTAEAIAERFRTFDARRYDPAVCRARAARFDSAVFARRMRDFVGWVDGREQEGERGARTP